MFFIFIEIIIVGVLASKLGMEASDKGLSRWLFMGLTAVVWIGSMFLGNLLGAFISYNRWISVLCGWTVALITYMILYWIISRMEDKYDFDEDKSWEERNKGADSPNSNIENK